MHLPSHQDDATRRIQQLATGHYGTQALFVAARLGIADLLWDGPQTADVLARQVGADGDALERVLRYLVSLGVFEEDEQGRFHLNELGEQLATVPQGSMKDFVMVFGGSFYQAVGNLLGAVQTGRDAFGLTFGRRLFDFLELNPEEARTFDRAMGAGSAFFDALPGACDFSRFSRIVDVGGGNGALLSSLLLAHPGLTGVLFDVQSVVDAAKANLIQRGVFGRVERVAGDFFESVVEGGDAYLLSRILHDWSDKQCLQILENCRRAIRSSGRILVIERLLPSEFAASADITMLAVTGGRERTRTQFARLLSAAGFQIGRVAPLPMEFNLIEGVAV